MIIITTIMIIITGGGGDDGGDSIGVIIIRPMICFAANMGMAALMAADMGINADDYRHWAMCQIHYALGDTGFSYVVGFGDQGWPRQPHHRGA